MTLAAFRPIVFSLVLSLAALPLVAQEEGEAAPPVHSIRLALEKGDVLEYLSTLTRTTRLVRPGSGEETLVRTVRETWTVEEVAGDAVTLRMETTAVQERVGGESRFDSNGMDEEAIAAAIEENPELAAMAGLVGRSFRVTVSTDGTVRSVEGLDEYFGLVRESFEHLEGESAADLRSILERELTEEAYRTHLQPLFDGPRSEPAEVGAEWFTTRRRSMVGAGEVVEEIRTTLDSVDEEGLLTLETRSEATFEEAADRPDFFAGTGFELADGQGSGTIVLDTVRGWITRRTVKRGWTVHLTLAGDEIVRIEQSVRETLEVELVEGKREGTSLPEEGSEESPTEEGEEGSD